MSHALIVLAICTAAIALELPAGTDWHAKAREAQRSRDFTGAANAYRKLLETDPANPQLITNLGIMLHLSGRNAEALTVLQRAIKARPDLTAAQLFAGLSLLNLERAAEALPYLERARTADPAGALPVLGLAKARAALGDFRAANDGFASASERDPANPEIWAGLGASYTALANTAAASFWTMNADFARINRALRMAGYPATREEMLATERSLARNSGDLVLLARLTRAYLALAVASYGRSAELEPRSFDYRMRLAESFVGVGRAEDATQAYERAAALRPDSARAYLGMAVAQRLAGGNDRAAAPLRKALELEPDNAEANGLMGDLLAKNGDFVRAGPLLERALKANPGLAPAHAALAKVYMAGDQPELALTAIRKALPADWDGAYYYQLSRVLRQLGRDEEAAAALEQFRARRALCRSAP